MSMRTARQKLISFYLPCDRSHKRLLRPLSHATAAAALAQPTAPVFINFSTSWATCHLYNIYASGENAERERGKPDGAVIWCNHLNGNSN